MNYFPPLVSPLDVKPWGWLLTAVIVLIGVLCSRKWPHLVGPALVSLLSFGVMAYAITLAVLSVDPRRDLGYVPLWRPLRGPALSLALALPYYTLWSLGLGAGASARAKGVRARVSAVSLALCSVIMFQVAMWCTDIVLD